MSFTFIDIPTCFVPIFEPLNGLLVQMEAVKFFLQLPILILDLNDTSSPRMPPCLVEVHLIGFECLRCTVCGTKKKELYQGQANFVLGGLGLSLTTLPDLRFHHPA